MTEADIQTINKEEHQDEEYLEQKIIFDNNVFEQIKGKELDLSVTKIFKIPTVRNWFKRQKEEFSSSIIISDICFFFGFLGNLQSLAICPNFPQLQQVHSVSFLLGLYGLLVL